MDLYTQSRIIERSEVFVWPPEDHGMGDSLDAYVERRLPVTALREPGYHIRKVSLLGLYPGHLEAMASELGLDRFDRLAFVAKPPRRLNSVRPVFLVSRDGSELVVCVPPGLDYLKHYTSLLRRFYTGVYRPPVFESRYFPRAAQEIATWTGLAGQQFEANSSVVLGHVDEFAQAVPELLAKLTTVFVNEYLTIERFEAGGRPVYLVAFAFSFWGETAGRLTEAIYENGAAEIIYLGKVGALDREIVLYGDLVIPDRFMLAEHDRVFRAPFAVPNGLVAATEGGGLHVTTPTVLEQSHLQRAAFAALAPRTIDNEIAYMARSADLRNRGLFGPGAVRFSSLSFATDYVRPNAQADWSADFNLANNRTSAARERRMVAMKRASRLLYHYLEVSSPLK